MGKKEGLAGGPSFPDDAKACMDAGPSLILLEAAELIGDDADTAREVEQVNDPLLAGPIISPSYQNAMRDCRNWKSRESNHPRQGDCI